MSIACNIYEYYCLTQSYKLVTCTQNFKHGTLASSYTHTYSTYTKAGRCVSGL